MNRIGQQNQYDHFLLMLRSKCDLRGFPEGEDRVDFDKCNSKELDEEKCPLDSPSGKAKNSYSLRNMSFLAWSIHDLQEYRAGSIETDSNFLAMEKDRIINSQGVYLDSGDDPLDVTFFLMSKIQHHLDMPRKFLFKGKEVHYTNLELLGDIDHFTIVGSSVVSEFLKECLLDLLPWLENYLTPDVKKRLFKKREDVDYRIQLLTNIDDLYGRTNRIIELLQEKVGSIGDIKKERGLSKLGRGNNLVMAGVDDLNSGMRQEFIFYIFDLKNSFFSTADNLRLEIDLKEGKVEKVYLAATERPWEEAVVHQVLNIFHLLHPENLNKRAWIKALSKATKGSRCLPTKRDGSNGEEMILKKIDRSRKNFGEILFDHFKENEINDTRAFFMAVAHLQKLYEYELDIEEFQCKIKNHFSEMEMQGFVRFFFRLICAKPYSECISLLQQLDFTTFKDITVHTTNIDQKKYLRIDHKEYSFFLPQDEDAPCVEFENRSFLEFEIAFHCGKKEAMVHSFSIYFALAKKEGQLETFFRNYEEAGLSEPKLKSYPENEIPLYFAYYLLNTEYKNLVIGLWCSLPNETKEKLWFPFVKAMSTINSERAFSIFKKQQASLNVSERLAHIIDATSFFPGKQSQLIQLLLPLLQKKQRLLPEEKEKLKSFAESFDENSFLFLQLVEVLNRKNICPIKKYSDQIVSVFLAIFENDTASRKELITIGSSLKIFEIDKDILHIYLKHLSLLSKATEKRVVLCAGSVPLEVEERKILFTHYQKKINKGISKALLKEIDQSKSLIEEEKIDLFIYSLQKKETLKQVIPYLVKRADQLNKGNVHQLKKQRFPEEFVLKCDNPSVHEQMFPLYQRVEIELAGLVFSPLKQLLISFLDRVEKKKALRMVSLLCRLSIKESSFNGDAIEFMVNHGNYRDASIVAKEGITLIEYQEVLIGENQNNLKGLINLIKTYSVLFSENVQILELILSQIRSKELVSQDIIIIFQFLFRTKVATIDHWKKLFGRLHDAKRWDKDDGEILLRFFFGKMMQLIEDEDPILLDPVLFHDLMYWAIHSARRVFPMELFQFYRCKTFPIVPLSVEKLLDLVSYLRTSLLDEIEKIESHEKKAKMLNQLMICGRMFVFYGKLKEGEYSKTIADENNKYQWIKSTYTFELECFAKALDYFVNTEYEDKIDFVMELMSDHLAHIPVDCLDNYLLTYLLKNLCETRSRLKNSAITSQLIVLLDEKYPGETLALSIENQVYLAKLMVMANLKAAGLMHGNLEMISKFINRLLRRAYHQVFEKYHSSSDVDFYLTQDEKELFKYGMMYLSNLIKHDPDEGEEVFDDLFQNTPLRKIHPSFFLIPFVQLNKDSSRGERWYRNISLTDLYFEIPLEVHRQVIRAGITFDYSQFIALIESENYLVEEKLVLLDFMVENYPDERERTLTHLSNLSEKNHLLSRGVVSFLSYYSYHHEKSDSMSNQCCELLRMSGKEYTKEILKLSLTTVSKHLDSWLPAILTQGNSGDLMLEATRTAIEVCKKNSEAAAQIDSKMAGFFRIVERQIDDKLFFEKMVLRLLTLLVKEQELIQRTFSKKYTGAFNKICHIFYEILKEFYISREDSLSKIIIGCSLDIFHRTLDPKYKYFHCLDLRTIQFMMNVIHLDQSKTKPSLFYLFVNYTNYEKDNKKELQKINKYFTDEFFPNIKTLLLGNPTEEEIEEFKIFSEKIASVKL